MHRMGSYFDPSLSSSSASLHHVGPSSSSSSSSHHNHNPVVPIKSILSLPHAHTNSSNAPPTPPPTSSIPKKSHFNKARPAGHSVNMFTAKSAPANRPVDRVRRNIARLRHSADADAEQDSDMRHISALNKRLASLTIADMSPHLVLQRILLLCDRGEHREAAAFIRRVSQPTYRQIVPDLPMDLFVDSMPHSMPVLEAIYAKVYLASSNGTLTMKGRLGDKFSPESVVWQIVRFFACHHSDGSSSAAAGAPVIPGRVEMCGPWVSMCKRLLSVLISAEPRIRRVVAERRKALTRAIEGLGQHGMVGTSDELLMNLREALRAEFGHTQKHYSDAVHKLDSLNSGGKSKSSSSSSSSSSSKSSAPPVAQSHQRQLSLRVEEIQERLIGNKKLLTAVEPALERQALQVLLGILQRRIELDKEVLFQFNTLKRDGRLALNNNNNGNNNSGGSKTSSNPSVAPVLMRFQRGCQQVLDLMHEVSDFPNSNDGSDASNGYHSDQDDSDSTVMMSGNSPFVSKSAKHNFLQRSVRPGAKSNLRSAVSAENLSQQQQQGGNHSNGDTGTIPKNSSNGNNNNSNNSVFLVCNSNSNVLLRGNNGNNINSSSGVSSCSNSAGLNSSSGGDGSTSSSASPPDTDSEEHHLNNLKRGNNNNNVVRIGPDGSASVVINSSGGLVSVGGNGANRTPRSRKLKKEIITKAVSIGDLSPRCGKCDNGGNKYHGVRCQNNKPVAVASNQTGEVSRLRSEVTALNADLDRANKTIANLRLEQARFHESLPPLSCSTGMDADSIAEIPSAGLTYDVSKGDRRPAALVRKFGDLYSMARLDTLDDLDRLEELKDATELKNKLLFSVVVLSFRSTTSSLNRLREQFRRLLQLPDNDNNDVGNAAAAADVDRAINAYLRRASDTFDLTKNVEDVSGQIWATLYDYPCLKSSAGLRKYVESCVRVSWGLVNQVPQYTIEYDGRSFQPDLQVRFHRSDHGSEQVRTYLWPALREGRNGPCVHKAVVIT